MKKLTKREINNLDFEISFYENLLKEKPDFIDVLIPLGDDYTKRGLYEKGLEVDLKLSKLLTDDPLVFYNLACSYSLLGKIDSAFEALERAINLGYSDFKWVDKDPDLENLRNDGRFLDFKKNKPYGSSMHKT